jgi:hypothetical protein
MAPPTREPDAIPERVPAEAASRALYDWWLRKRDRRPMPMRSELDPQELKPILPHLVIVAVGRENGGDGLTFTCRLAGTEIDSRLGIRVTGLSLDDAPFGEHRASIRAQYETVVREKRPVFCVHNMVVNHTRYVEYDRMAVPLGDAAGEVSTLLAALDFHCAYGIEQGRPPNCPRPAYCDRIDLCLARIEHEKAKTPEH